MAKKKGKKMGAKPKAKKGIKTIWECYPHKGVTSIVICLVIWILVGVAAWFLIGDLLFLYDEGVLDQYTREINMEYRWKRTLVIAIVQLLLMVWPICEYLFVFHKPMAIKDRYKWYVPFIVMICVSLVAIIIVNGITLTLGWLTLVQILATLAVIMIPRFAFPPR